MSKLITRSFGTLLAPALALGLLVAEASAQQPEAAAESQCIATAEPATIQAGQTAVRVGLSLSEGIGAVTGLSAPEGSGLAIAAPEDIPRAELASPDAPQSQPIELAADAETAVTVWLRTQEVQAGEFDVTVQGETGTCRATITVATP